LRIERYLVNTEFHLLADVEDIASRGAGCVTEAIGKILERGLQ
jgi:hypothetical protein